MDYTGQRKNCVKLLFTSVLFNIVCSHELGSGGAVNTSIEKRFADPVLEPLPSWPYAAGNGVPKHGTASLHSHNRWPTQIAFSKAVYSFQVKEDTIAGTVVGKVESVLDSLTPIMYSVQEDDGENLFLLSPLSGEFLLSRSLDFETQQFFILTVAVQQGDWQVSSVRVYFNVLDVNDNAPVFRPGTFSASLSEDTKAGTCFLHLNVSDEDDGDNGDLNLRVAGGDEGQLFFINPTHYLCLKTELDREKNSSYRLTVAANDHAQPMNLQLTSTAYVDIQVNDVNDNTPVFLSAKSVSVPEDAPLYFLVMTIHAEDADFGTNGEVIYYLSNTLGGMFNISDDSGRLYLQETLDREQVDHLTITVIAADKGSPRFSTTMTLTVHIEDANDHDPEFLQSNYNLTVPEDTPKGTSLFQVEAHDQDIGLNGQVRYSLSLMSPFVVDRVRGIVIVMDKLDRERESNYTFFVTAEDRGNISRSGTAVVTVTVLDINDCAPMFSPETLIIHVMEDEVDVSLLTHQVLALDDDTGVNSQLTYVIQAEDGDGLFTLTPTGIFQILNHLDREKESLYIISIIAVDSGLPPLTGTLTMHIIVDDINDNHPVFAEDVYNTIVSEDSPTGTVFAMITASDIDEGVNGDIRYFMENLDVPFSIEEMSGELFTTDVLDRETEAIYRLTVIGSDKHPTHPLSSSVLIIVLIGDVNDNWPQFLNSPYVAYVPTEMAAGSVVCAVTAVDTDTEMNAELQYSLYGQQSDHFSIDPYTGTVFTSKDLRRTEDIIINLHVEDTGENSKLDNTTIRIRFQNLTDFPKLHVDIFKDSLPEDEPVGTLVAVISGASVRAEPVLFYLASGNSEETFHMDHFSGALTVENPLDFENKKDFSLLIEARDSGSPPYSSFTEIHINISDVNDNIPHFTQAEYRCEVFENTAPTWVCDVLAIDADSGSYGAVEYNITEGNSGMIFTIDRENGMLSTTVSLDRENISEFNLTIQAAEFHNLLHSTTANVIIVVIDRNDNAPRFSQIFLTEISEDAPIGHTVIQVTCSDDDSGANAVIHYSINDQNDMPFNIHITTGHITVARHLDREKKDRYVVKVTANDSAWSILTDVTIVIADVNDNKPLFLYHFYSVILAETEVEEVFVVQVLATDADIGQNSHILYVIEPPNEEFWVNAFSGEIFTSQILPLHTSDMYYFTVTASDCGSVPLYSNVTVTVRLEPRNYYPPVFLLFQPHIAIPYHMAVGTEVVQCTAVDPDYHNSSADIVYALNGGNASEFFQIQADNGKVMLNQSLTESIHLFLILFVTAQDQGHPSLLSQTEITFEITGRNQFSPSFTQPDATFSVPEDLAVGSVIGRILAEDRDYGPNGVVLYYIIPDNLHLPFSIRKDSGLLTLIQALDFEKEGFYNFQVKAMDGGWLSKTGVLNVTVTIMDVNDNPPVFSASEYVTSVPENSEIGTSVLDIKASDADSGANSQITYSLIAGQVDKFVIDSRNGTLTILDVFDYEQVQIFDVTVKASNNIGQPLFSLAHVIIQIADVNEFTPKFKKKLFHFSVLKNVPIGATVGKVTATDDDQGTEGQVFYLMFGQNKFMGFEIMKYSGEIYTTRSLRKQGNSHVVLKVLAKNPGVIIGWNVDEVSVRISVIDTNDAPVFASLLYHTNVREDGTVGTSVMAVSAVDHDSVMEWNRFFFSIERGNTNLSFAINPSSGVISVNAPLDREQWSFYNLTVTATDNGYPPATGTTNVIVTIGDINDNAPKLTLTEAEVKENQPQGTIVTRLNASDSDLPPNQEPFTYWLLNSSTENGFSLTSEGALITTMPADREQVSAYRMLVVVRDAGIPPLSSTTVFHIRIADENDNPSLPRNIFIEVKYFGSSFQGGMIGNVHPEDPDESDTFHCGIISRPLHMFSVPNHTCELWSAPFQGEATYNITIEATDQMHFPVNNSIYINYKGFTNASVDSCILFYVSSSSMEDFLEHKYLKFVKALDSLFNMQASKTHVFGIKHIGTEILLLAAVKNYNGQYLSSEVASGISAGHKKLLETQSNVTISQIASDPCHTNPCQSGATCNKNIYISQDVTVLESMSVIFVSPQKEIFNCTCPKGFTGSLCEEDMNECEMNPCHYQGSCINTPGGFYCNCQNGFSGSVCSNVGDDCLKIKCHNGGACIQTQDGSHCHCAPGFEGEFCENITDHCKSTPCVHGSCVNSYTGFSCHCPFGVSGVHCKEDSYGFEELSFMEFPPLDRRTNLISVEFATVQRNGLLLYNAGGTVNKEFLALEILNGSVHFSYDLGSGPVKLQTNKQVTDGIFHNITARRIGNMGSLHVDNCTDDENDGLCFSQGDGSSSERTLDVGSSNMTFGGLRTIDSILKYPPLIRTHNFVGCVRKINVNGVLLRPSEAITKYNVHDRCSRANMSPCHSIPCKNGGICHDLWFNYRCECKSPFAGINCDKEMSEELVLRFNENDYIEYVIKERFRRDYGLQRLIEDGNIQKENQDLKAINIKFKTEEDGVLLFFLGHKGHMLLEIKDKKPVYVFKDIMSGDDSKLMVDSSVADGTWHVLSLFSKGQKTFLHLDGKLVVNASDRSIDLTPVNVEKIVLGAPPLLESKLQKTGLSGCVQYFNVTGYTLPVSGHNEMVEVWPSLTLLQSSCRSPGVCLPWLCSQTNTPKSPCFSSHCQNWPSCGPALQNASCICFHNVSNQPCDICVSRAQSSDQCREEQDSVLLWLVAIILPVLCLLVITGLFVTFRRVRRQNASCDGASLPQKGSDNAVFCFDDSRTSTAAACVKQHDPAGVDQQTRNLDLYSIADASLSGVEPLTNSELEYYEIGRDCSTFHSNAASLKFSWHKHLYNAKCLKGDPKRWSDLKLLFSDLKKACLSEERTGNPRAASINKQLLSNIDSKPHYMMSSTKPRLLEKPAQYLTFEEINKLNTPAKQTTCCSRSSPMSVVPNTVMNVVRDSEADATLTILESECGQFSRDQTITSTCSFTQQSILPVSSLTCDSAEGQPGPKSPISCSFEQWESILNMRLHFSTYAPVFEDIACFPIETVCNCDMQSDIEEII
ncbi:protocadherin Fat 4 [Thalassophryne amazonica]|uniref:protocadherin Fat 4 n=1 Tax=Thalassophryne amazonica TaxID=390379 RepID=UPI0014724CB1|nr:protocadherin Fat 4 [Thalassophryne amazonica]